MIYTVTLNPTLDITYVVDHLKSGHTNQAKRVLKSPGGKGINVSRALHNMRTDSVALALIGGFTGTEVEHLLRREGLLIWLVRISNETRTNVFILDEKTSEEVNVTSQGPKIKAIEHKTLLKMINEVVRSPGYLILSGSIPPAVQSDIYGLLIRKAKRKGIFTVLDASGEPLRSGIPEKPHLIKPNRHELEQLLGRGLATDARVLKAAMEIVEAGVETVIVSLGEDGAILVRKDCAFRGRGPAIDGHETVGAGDATVAGILIAMQQGKPPGEMLRIGMACGTAAVMEPGPELCKPASFKRALPLIQIEEITRK